MKTFGDLVQKYQRATGLSQQDLAHQASVSQSVLSRAISTGEPTLPNARLIVTALAEVYGLQWSELRELAEAYLLTEGQREARNTCEVIGVLIPNIRTSPFWGQLAGAIEKHAADDGRVILLSQHGNKFDSYSRNMSFLQGLDSLVGVISVPPYGDGPLSGPHRTALSRLTRDLARREVPMVYVDRWWKTYPAVPYVGPNNVQAGRLAVEYLKRKGHRRIGALINLGFVSAQQERLEGFCQALGDQCNRDWVKIGEKMTGRNEANARDPLRGKRNALELLRLPEDDRPTAVFCATYRLALDLVAAAKECSVRVPEDVSVIGFDDIADLDAVTPRVTRVGYDIEELAQAALKKLLLLIKEPKNEQANEDCRLQELQVIERDSVKDLRRGDDCSIPVR